MSNLKPLALAKQEWLSRELHCAQMIVASPCGTWPQSIVDLANRMLRQWAGWNVTSLPTASSETSRRSRATEPARALSELPAVLDEMRRRKERQAIYRAQFDLEGA